MGVGPLQSSQNSFILKDFVTMLVISCDQSGLVPIGAFSSSINQILEYVYIIHNFKYTVYIKYIIYIISYNIKYIIYIVSYIKYIIYVISYYIISYYNIVFKIILCYIILYYMCRFSQYILVSPLVLRSSRHLRSSAAPFWAWLPWA